MLCLIDAAARMSTVESGTGQERARASGRRQLTALICAQATLRRKGGPSLGGLRRGGRQRGASSRPSRRRLSCWTRRPARRARRADYLRSLKAKPQIFAWSEAEPLSALGATDRLLVGEVAHEPASPADDCHWPPT